MKKQQNHKPHHDQTKGQYNLYDQLTPQLKRKAKITNNVLVDVENKTIFLPGYLRMKIKNFTEINLQNLDAQINASLIFNVYYGLLLQFLKNKSLFSQQKKKGQDIYTINQQNIIDGLQQQIILNFPRDDAILLSQTNNSRNNLQTKVKHQAASKQFKYTVRKLFRLYLQGELFWSPLQTIYSIIQITLQPIQIKIMKIKNGKVIQEKWTIKINLMDNPQTNVKISYGDQLSFSNYSLIKRKLAAFYSNHRISSNKQFYMGYKKRKQFIKQKNDQKKNKKQQLTNKKPQSNIQQSSINQPEKEKESASFLQARLILQGIYGNKKPHNQSSVQNKLINQSNQAEQQKILNQSLQKLKQKKHQNQKDKKKVEYFQHAHFNIPLFKDPLSAIVTIFLPLWLLALINLAIFFQNSVLADRIGSISALMIAFVAFIPTIRQQIPPNPDITFVEIIIYLQTSTSLLALLHSMNVKGQLNFIFVWNQSGQFILALILSIGCCVPVIIQIAYHYLFRIKKFQKQFQKSQLETMSDCYKQQNQKLTYNDQDQKQKTLDLNQADNEKQRLLKSKQKKKDSQKFNRDQWSSQNCDLHFQQVYKFQLLKQNLKINAVSQKADILFLLKAKSKQQKQSKPSAKPQLQAYNSKKIIPESRFNKTQQNYAPIIDSSPMKTQKVLINNNSPLIIQQFQTFT